MTIPRIIVTLVLAFLLTCSYVVIFAQDQPETTEETIPIKPTVEYHHPPPKPIIVFSFYDTQLELLCYSVNSGITCIQISEMSDRAKMFINDRTEKYKEDLFGPDSIRFPRIVPLDN